MIRRLLVVAFFLVGSACTSSGDEAVTATSSETTTTTAATTTSVETTTSTSTTAEPEWTAEELEVVAAYEAYDAMWQLSLVDLEAAIALLPEVMDDPLLSSNLDGLTGLRDQGATIDGRSEFEIKSVELSSSEAVVVECGLDALSATSPDGEVLVEPDLEASSAEITFTRREGRWRASERVSGEPC